MTIAQEHYIENMTTSKRFAGLDYNVSELSNGYVILEIEENGEKLEWAISPTGEHDVYYWGVAGYKKWREKFYKKG